MSIDIYYMSAEEIREEQWEMLLELVPQSRREAIEVIRRRGDRACSLCAGLLLAYARRRKQIPADAPEYKEAHGRPCLDYGSWDYNLSHTSHWAVCAIGDERLGIDMEETERFRDHEDRNRRLLEHIANEAERECFEGTEADRENALARIWTRKEAHAKRIGNGILMDFPSIDTLKEEEYLTVYPEEGLCISLSRSQTNQVQKTRIYRLSAKEILT